MFGKSLSQAQKGDYRPATLVLLAGLSYALEYGLYFVFVGLVSSLAFSVADIARRLTTIVVGAMMFNKILTSMNILGISLALSGVLAYSIVNKTVKKEKSN